MLNNHQILPLKKLSKQLLLGLCILTNVYFVQAQMPGLRVNYNFTVADGGRQGSVIAIERDGRKYLSRDGDNPKMYVDLEFQHNYVLSFIKQGYVVKKVEVSTMVPEANSKDVFHPDKIDITIYKEKEGTNVSVFEKPVMRIAYNPATNNFEIDAAYSKKLAESVNATEKDLKTVEPVPLPPSIKPKVAATQEKPAENTAVIDNQKKLPVANVPDISEEEKAKRLLANEEKAKAAAIVEPAPIVDNSVSRVEKEYVDGNKKVVETTVTSNGKKVVYKKVTYTWAVYYYRDNIGITEDIYVKESQ